MQGRTATAQQESTPPRQLKTAVAAVSYERPQASFPHGVLTAGALVPTVRKLPFLALGLVALAILLLALGALPASVAPHPAVAGLLVDRRPELALGGLLMLAASIVAYLLV